MRRDEPRAQAERMVDLLADRGISDERVLAAMAAVPREAFVPAELRAHAYEDRPLPIAAGQTISQPWIVARMAELLDLAHDDRVLDVGCGSGYAAAVLSHLAGEVWSIERRPALAAAADRTLRGIGLAVHVVVGDGRLGLPEAAPFDAISVAAATPSVPPALVEQLTDTGRLVLPLGEHHAWQRLVRVTRAAGGEPVVERLTSVSFVPLLHGVEGEAPTTDTEA